MPKKTAENINLFQLSHFQTKRKLSPFQVKGKISTFALEIIDLHAI